MDPVQSATPYELIGGADAVSRLVEAFYPRVQGDPELAPIFPADIRPVMERQRRFLTQFLGGPPLYSELYGPPMLRARHLTHPVTPSRRVAWLRCMAEAMEETGFGGGLREAIFARLAAVAQHMVNRADGDRDSPPPLSGLGLP